MVVCCRGNALYEHPFSTWLDVVEALRCDEHPFSTWLDVVEAMRCDEHPFSTWLDVVEATRCDEHPFSTWLYVHRGIALSMNILSVRGCML